MSNTALYLLSLALRPVHDETREFVKVLQADAYREHPTDGRLPEKAGQFASEVRKLAEAAPSAIRYDGSTGNLYLTRPEIHESAWEALFPGLDLEGLMCAAMDGGYALGVPLGRLEKLPNGITHKFGRAA